MIKLKNNIKCLVTGGNGFLGSHLINELKKKKIKIYITSSKQNDLRDFNQVEKIFKKFKPQIVFNLAAKVGGILDNKNKPADYFFDNIQIISNTFELAKIYKVKKIINVGAGCGYPLNAKEPLKEQDIFNGIPQKESIAYSTAKKMLFTAAEAYNKQYGLKSNVIIPSNLYGEYDNFNLKESHVIPALVRKFYESTLNKRKEVNIWGNGLAKRDFIYAKDVAKSLIYLCEYSNDLSPVNICTGSQISIKQIAQKLLKISGFKGKIVWQKNMPEGQRSRSFSTSKLRKVLKNRHKKFTSIDDGLSKTYQWFQSNYKKNIRL